MFDRIELGTYIIAAGICGKKIKFPNVDANLIKTEIKTLKKKYLPNIEKVASYLNYHGIFFAGVDMIGDYITEINITSPTGIQQIGNRLPSRIANELIKNIDNYYT